MHLSSLQLIKRPVIFQRLTGLSVKEFEKLLAPFSAQYEQLVIGPRVNAAGRVRAGAFKSRFFGGGGRTLTREPATLMKTVRDHQESENICCQAQIDYHHGNKKCQEPCLI